MKRRALLAFLFIAAPLLAAAQDAPADGWRAEYLAELADQHQKLVALAESLPADMMTWRPADGVRSFSEVFLHIGAANYGLSRRLGADMPDGMDIATFERSTTDKAEVVARMDASFDHLRNAVLVMPDTASEDEFDWFGGRKNTKRGLLMFMAKHTGEHQGQLVAYSRMNGHVPPWSTGG